MARIENAREEWVAPIHTGLCIHLGGPIGSHGRLEWKRMAQQNREKAIGSRQARR